MATKKGADEEKKKAQRAPASKRTAGAGSRSAAKADARPAAKRPAKSTAKASAAGRGAAAKRPATPRIRASHAGISEAGKAKDRPQTTRRAAGERPARPIPADRPARPRRAAAEPAPAPHAAHHDHVEAPANAELQEAAPSAPNKAAGARPAGRKAPLAGPKRATPRRSVPPAPQPSAPARELALTLAAAGLDKKAIGVEILEVVGRVDYADYLVIMTGRSDRHVHAIATGLDEATRKQAMAPLSIEGLAAATWVLIDYGDVVVHVFQEEARRLYDIEGLWIDAGRVPVPDDHERHAAPPAPRPDPS